MPLPVPLQEVLDAIDPIADGWSAYINRTTGEIVAFGEEEASAAEGDALDAPGWMRDALPKIRAAIASDDYAALPDKFDFHEYAVMERFCLAQEAEELRGNLLDAIRGSGAFRRFKDRVHAAGIQDDWYAFRDRALRDVAVGFLESQDIPYVDKKEP